MKSYDTIAIGLGKGGKTLAGYMAKQGKRTAMIEKSDQMYEGTRIDEGCIPLELSIIQTNKQSYGQTVEHKEAFIEKLRKKNFDKLDSLEPVDIITVKAPFVSDHEVHVQGTGVGETLYGDYIFFNTGSASNILNIKGIHEARHIYISMEMMKEHSLSAKLAIIGGYIGLESSSVYIHYGGTVTVFEHGSRLVEREDQNVAGEIQKVLEKQGVSLVFESGIKEFANDGEQAVIAYDDAYGIRQRLTVDVVLLAVGRSANTKQSHLENIGVKLDQRGNIVVNEYLQTSVSHTYAVDDVKGGLQPTHVPLGDCRIVKDRLFGNKQRTTKSRGQIAYPVFISPTFSRVGLNEQEVREQGYVVKTTSMSAAAILRASIILQLDGLLKTVIDTKADQILDCIPFCAESKEVINFAQLAMNQRLIYQEVGNHISTHPTVSEAPNDLLS